MQQLNLKYVKGADIFNLKNWKKLLYLKHSKQKKHLKSSIIFKTFVIFQWSGVCEIAEIYETSYTFNTIEIF